jgi:hypothetical protein
MDMAIGEAVGRMGPYLVEHGETTLRQLQRGTTLSERLLQMRVGWRATTPSALSRSVGA